MKGPAGWMARTPDEQLKLPFPCEPDLTSIFSDALRAVARKRRLPDVEARFYPYAGLSSTIRLRSGRVSARVSDLLKHSPPEVLYALACILVAKLYKAEPSKDHEALYRRYTSQPAVLDASDASRRNRGYKVVTSPHGRFYDLDAMFTDLNHRYFAGSLDRPLLSWSRQRTRRVLGHHDHAHGTIVISRTLDSRKVPDFAVEYVLYHEMLHVKHPPRTQDGRTIYHSDEFRTEEKKYERFREALKWLDELASPVRRRRRRVSRRRGVR